MPTNSEDCSNEPPDPIIIEVDPNGRYFRYKEVLGKGAFKTVYKAFDEIDEIDVAWIKININDLKQIPDDLEGLYPEVRLLESINHVNIVKLYTWWVDEANKTLNFITELLTSGSLKQYLKKCKKVNVNAVKRRAKQILMGLNYLHSQKPPIIHRDLKCDNIFINGNSGEVKIGDLGLATVMKEPKAKTITGTPEFMAPELYNEEYNELVDIYSFGMCLLEMVTFEYPYSECTGAAQIYKKVTAGMKPASLSKVKDEEVKVFIEKCLVPASKRLSAKDLLNDPFLKLDETNSKQDKIDSKLDKTDSTSKTQINGSIYLHENGGLKEEKSKCSLEPPFVTKVILSGSDGQMEILLTKNDNRFCLRGKIKDANSVDFVLLIQEEDSDCKPKIEFLFNLSSDTALSVASEMVEEDKVINKDKNFIAKLIDLLLMNLISGWKSCISVESLLVN